MLDTSILPVIVLYVAIVIGTLVVVIKKFETNQLLVLGVVIAAFLFGGVLLFALPSITNPTTPPKSQSSAIQQLSAVGKLNPDPFTYTPGASTNGIISSADNASSYPDQHTCQIKSGNTVWSDDLRKCSCQIGWFGPNCDQRAYSDNYVTLTTSSKITPVYGASFAADSLSLWSGPGVTAVTGCTDQCSQNSNCIGVAYNQGSCTPITSLTFLGAPVHDASVPSTSDTIYLNKSRLTMIKMSGYYNIITGNLPPRYFIGNVVAGLTGQNYYTTNTGSRILYFSIGSDNTFVGIPDFIIVNSLGNLYISTTTLPAVIPTNNSNGLIVSYVTPITLTRDTFLNNFGRSTDSTSFYIRYIQS